MDTILRSTFKLTTCNINLLLQQKSASSLDVFISSEAEIRPKLKQLLKQPLKLKMVNENMHWLKNTPCVIRKADSAGHYLSYRKTF